MENAFTPRIEVLEVINPATEERVTPPAGSYPATWSGMLIRFEIAGVEHVAILSPESVGIRGAAPCTIVVDSSGSVTVTDSPLHPKLALPEVEVLPNLPSLPVGTIVRLPDGDIGTIAWSDRRDAHVMHPGRQLGAGPWVFSRHQVEPLAAHEVPLYLDSIGGGIVAHFPVRGISVLQSFAAAAG